MYLSHEDTVALSGIKSEARSREIVCEQELGDHAWVCNARESVSVQILFTGRVWLSCS